MPSAKPPRQLLPLAALVYCALIWGSTFIVVKAAILKIDPVALVAWRFVLSACGMALLILARGRFRLQALAGLFRGFGAGLYLGLLLAVLYLAQTLGLVFTTASNSGFITGLFVVFVPLLGWGFLRQRIKLHQALAVLIATGGLWLLTGGVHGANRGDYLTLLCAVTYALHVLYAGRCMERGVDPWVLNFQQVLVTGLFALAAALAFARPLAPAAPGVMWAVLFLTIFPTLGAFMLQLWGQQFIDPARTALVFTLEPVSAAVFAWTLGGEALLPLKALGGALIVLAMVISEAGGIQARRTGEPALDSNE